MIFSILMTSCSMFQQKTEPVIPYQVQHKPLDLSYYKGIETSITPDGKICLSYDDYTKSIELLNVLKDYIQYQKTLINEMDKYYNPPKK